MSPEYIKTLLKLTKVSSEDVISATIAHLCGGQSQPGAAQAHGVQQEAIARLVKRLRELDSIVSEATEKKQINNS